jgi:hypothetical protein
MFTAMLLINEELPTVVGAEDTQKMLESRTPAMR